MPLLLDTDVIFLGQAPPLRAELDNYFPVIHNIAINSYNRGIYSSHIFTFLDFILLVLCAKPLL